MNSEQRIQLSDLLWDSIEKFQKFKITMDEFIDAIGKVFEVPPPQSELDAAFEQGKDAAAKTISAFDKWLIEEADGQCSVGVAGRVRKAWNRIKEENQ